MFLFKKIVAPFLFPVPVSLALMVIGLLLLWFSRRQRGGKLFVTLGTVLLAAFSFDFVSGPLLATLEDQHAPLLVTGDEADAGLLPARTAKWIVVLGGGHGGNPAHPAMGQLDPSSMSRLMEALRLRRQLPGCRVVFSGGKIFDATSDAELMAQAAGEIGIDADFVLETESRDTKDQARIIKAIVGNDALILVTSAAHMPRSLALFRKAGMNPIPAPCGYATRGAGGFRPSDLHPHAGSLGKAESAFHEYLGLAWGWFRGQL